MKPLFKNNATSTLRFPITAGATGFQIGIDDGAKFPSVGAGEYFMVTLFEPTTGAMEIVKCTARASDTLTVERAQEGTTGLSFAAGAYVQARLTAAMLDDLRDRALTTDPMPAFTLKGNITGSLAAPTNVTVTQLMGALPNFTTADDGLVPASGAGTAKFLRGDGLWADPPGSDTSITALLLSPSASFANHRVLGVADGLKKTDAGAGGALTLGLDPNGVGLDKLQQIGSELFLGRLSPGSGNVELLTATQLKTALSVASTDISGLATQLAAKADKTYVDSQLTTKLNISSFNSYTASVTSALAGKADNSAFQAYQTTVTSALAAKADKTSFDSFVTTTNAAIATKADSAGVQLTAEKGVANGYAGLGSDGKVPTSQLPDALSGTASGVPFTPVGNIAATNVQSALFELDTEKAPLASPAFTGTPTAPTPSAADNSTKLATTAFVQGQVATLNTAVGAKAPLASPVFTGDPRAPTPAISDNDTSLATTAFVQALIEDILVGTIQAFAGASIPTGYLICNGAEVSRTTYAKLFAKIGTSHGAGNGSTTFNLPDLCGRAIIGRDTAAKNRVTAAISGLDSAGLGNAGGSQSLQSHGHTTTSWQDAHTHSDGGHSHGAYQASHNHGIDFTGYRIMAAVTEATGFKVFKTGDGAGGFTDRLVVVSGPGNNFTWNAQPAVTVNTGYASLNWQQPNVYTSVAATGSGGSQNVQPSIVENYIIYAGR